MKRAFGRLVEFDERSRNFPIMALISADKTPVTKVWDCAVSLNQGSEPACTGFAVCHEAAAEPVAVKGITNKVALALYKRAQQLDCYPGENYAGSTVLAAMKAATEKGWYKSYRWAFGEEDLALAVSHMGPAVLGIPWYTGMSKPDKYGLVKVEGEFEGNHAIMCRGIHVEANLYSLKNTWTAKWGVGGDCLIGRNDMRLLLKKGNQGEACIPLERCA